MRQHFFAFPAIVLILSCFNSNGTYARGIGGPGVNAGMSITTLGNKDQDLSHEDYMNRLNGGAGIKVLDEKGVGIGARTFIGLAKIRNKLLTGYIIP